MTHFTQEEKSLIGIYNTGGRLFTVANMQNALPNIDDPAMAKLVRTVISKLIRISDREFRTMPESMIL